MRRHAKLFRCPRPQDLGSPGAVNWVRLGTDRVKAQIDLEPLTIIVTDLIDQGLVTPPARAFGIYRGKRIEALLLADGTFVHRGNRYSSPSVAAGRAITAEAGAISTGRNYFSVNGWKFWQVICPDGKSRSLADLRNQLLEC